MTEFVTIGYQCPNDVILELPRSTEQHIVFGTNHEPRTNIGATAFTHNIPKEFWDAWVALHKKQSILTEGQIFAHKTEESAKAEAKDKIRAKTGMEPIDPSAVEKSVPGVTAASKG